MRIQDLRNSGIEGLRDYLLHRARSAQRRGARRETKILDRMNRINKMKKLLE
jgi:hypothetical protein